MTLPELPAGSDQERDTHLFPHTCTSCTKEVLSRSRELWEERDECLSGSLGRVAGLCFP